MYKLFYRTFLRRNLHENVSDPHRNFPEIIQYQLASKISKVDPKRVEQYLSRKDDVLSDEALLQQLNSPKAQKQLSFYGVNLPSLRSTTSTVSYVATQSMPRPTFQGMHDEELRKNWVNDQLQYKNLAYPSFFFEKLALLERRMKVKSQNKYLHL
jgi:hypothetical protein